MLDEWMINRIIFGSFQHVKYCETNINHYRELSVPSVVYDEEWERMNYVTKYYRQKSGFMKLHCPYTPILSYLYSKKRVIVIINCINYYYVMLCLHPRRVCHCLFVLYYHGVPPFNIGKYNYFWLLDKMYTLYLLFIYVYWSSSLVLSPRSVHCY